MQDSSNWPPALREAHRTLARRLHSAAFGAPLGAAWQGIIEDLGETEGRRWLCRNDRFYLLTVECNRQDMMHPWLYARCREVEAEPDTCIDLWAREHYKSTIITFGGIIQEVLCDPEVTIGIFSHVKPVARKFMLQIKQEFESNAGLKSLFPDILYDSPQREAVKWSEEKGLQVRRKGNAKEATIEAHGLVDGMPTGAHFRLRVYDDVVTLESVSTPEQVKKTSDAWALSDNLGAKGARGEVGRAWHIGTRYSFADTYQDILDREILKARIYPATDNGLAGGAPVFLTPEAWARKKATQTEAIIACQMLQNPAAGNEAMFRKEWAKFTDIRPATLNVYVTCDPASSRKKGSDRTAVAVIGVDAAHNKYLLDGYHHKMSLSERWAALKGLRRVWMNMPGVQMVKVGYERYGMTSDLEYFEEQMLRERDAFEIVELAWPREGPGSKIDRIQRLQPDFKAGKFFLAALASGETANQRRVREAGQAFRVMAPVKRRDHTGDLYSLNKNFLEEFLVYPFSAHDDFLDAVSRIYDMEPVPPILIDEKDLEPEVYVDGI
jgi:hypothetical protein